MNSDNNSRLPFLPYGRQNIDDDDIEAVVKVLKSDWLTQGPTIALFEDALKKQLKAEYVVACSSGTAALHLSMLATGIGEGDKIITSPITFLASANCARYVGAEVEFVDIDPDTALIDLKQVEKKLKSDTEKSIKAIIPVHFAGQPVDLPALYKIAEKYNIIVVDDACHAVGGSFDFEGQEFKIGGNPFSDMSAFSFHPVKHITTGEGGVVSTNDEKLAEKLRRFRNHGMRKDTKINKEMAMASDSSMNPWYYEMEQFGYNYRITDIQASLGLSQLDKLEYSVKKRQKIAKLYRQLIDATFEHSEVTYLKTMPNTNHAYHLFVLQINFDQLKTERAVVMNKLRENRIGSQVHYIPVHLQPYYRKRYNYKPGDFPQAENYYQKALSIPMYPELTDENCARVIDTLKKIIKG